MSGTTILITILVLSLTGLAAVPLWLKRVEQAQKNTIGERIRPYVDQAYREELARQKSVEEEEESFTLIRGMAERLSALALSEEIQQSLRDWLLRAGLRVRPAEYLVINIVVMTVFAFIAALMAWALVGSMTFLFGLIGFATGWVFPFLYVLRRRRKRLQKFNDQLLDLITYMSNGLKSGLSFTQAMKMVAEESNPPASEEFHRVLRENNLGVPIDKALTRLVERMESEDLDLVVTAILIQRQVGGNLSEVLDSISSTIRERIKLQGMIRALTAQGRAGGFVISLLPVVLFLAIYLLKQELVLNFIQHPIGIVSLLVGVLMQATGIFFVWQIVNIDV